MSTYTEEEARKKWCPFASVGAGHNRIPNDDGEPTDSTYCRCIASGCMAWRVGPPRQEGQVFIPGGTLYDDALKLSPHAAPGIKQWGADQKAAGHVPLRNAAKFAGIALEWIERETPTGFCGLAGRSE